MKIIDIVTGLLGGLGLILYGMKLMREGLENAAGQRLKGFIEGLSLNPFKGILVGTSIGALTQSSSAATLMIIGFVNAGLMNLPQAAGLILGTNIGTTITVQVVSCGLVGIAPLFVGLGALIALFSKAKKSKEIGHIILGFGILFMGINLMETTFSPITATKEFETIVFSLNDSPLLGILIGMIITAVIQSSSATTSILIAMSGSGAIPLSAAIPILLGTNIGTCVTTLLSSINTSKDARRTALIHLIFNITGTIIFTVFLTKFIEIVQLFSSSNDIKRQLANAHTLFNTINTLILAGFIPLVIKLVNMLIPGNDRYELIETKYIDERLLETSAIAVSQAKKEIIRMANKAKQNIELSMKAFKNNDEALIKKVFENEQLINTLEAEIISFLAKLANKEISNEDSELITSMYHVVNDIERIGDHAENLAELAQEKSSRKLSFSDQAFSELDHIYGYTLDALSTSIESFKNHDISKAKSVLDIEERIDNLEKELRLTHIKRLNNGSCTAHSGTVFLDMISNLERVADHAMNIAESVYKRF